MKLFRPQFLCIPALLSAITSCATQATGPSFSCGAEGLTSIEKNICSSKELSALDRHLDQVYQEALQKVSAEQLRRLKASQRGWIKGRNDCWKSQDIRACIEDNYQYQIADLQIRYGLIPSTSPTTYICNQGQGGEIGVRYYETTPQGLLAEYGDSTSIMYLQPTASGTKYVGQNEIFWEHQGQATLQWGYNAPQMTCTIKR